MQKKKKKKKKNWPKERNRNAKQVPGLQFSLACLEVRFLDKTVTAAAIAFQTG